jgi:hypothetical protein
MEQTNETDGKDYRSKEGRREKYEDIKEIKDV